MPSRRLALRHRRNNNRPDPCFGVSRAQPRTLTGARRHIGRETAHDNRTGSLVRTVPNYHPISAVSQYRFCRQTSF